MGPTLHWVQRYVWLKSIFQNNQISSCNTKPVPRPGSRLFVFYFKPMGAPEANAGSCSGSRMWAAFLTRTRMS